MPRGNRYAPEKTRRCNFMLPESIDKAIGHAAVEQGKDRTQIVVEALRAYLPALAAQNPAALDELAKSAA